MQETRRDGDHDLIGCPEKLPLDTQNEALASTGTPNVKQLNINIPWRALGAQSTLVHTGFHLLIYVFALLLLSDNKLTGGRGPVISNLTMSVRKISRHCLTHIIILSHGVRN